MSLVVVEKTLVVVETTLVVDVDPGAGLATMLIGVVLVSLMGMLGGCASGSDDDEKLHLASQRAYDSGTELAGGYAKSL